MKFNEKLITLRKENELTQEGLAEKLSISRQSISKWEQGKGYPDIENLISISDYYGISLDELLKEDKKLENKIVKDSKSNKYYLISVIYLCTIILYIGYFYIQHHIFMVGFLISTIFMTAIELYVFLKK